MNPNDLLDDVRKHMEERKAYWESPEGKAELNVIERTIGSRGIVKSPPGTRHTRDALARIRDILRRAGWDRADDSGD